MKEILPYVIELKEEDLTFDPRGLVADGMPIELEIGCGNGRFLTANAIKHPEIHYFGVERMMDRVRRCSRKAERGALANLTFVRVEAGRFVRELLPDHCLNTLYLFFPDPWPKRRHHRNRFFQQDLCTSLARVLVPNGKIYISTDHEEYFKEMLCYLTEDVRFEPIPVLLREEDEQTDFERLFLAKGDPIYHCAFQCFQDRKESHEN